MNAKASAAQESGLFLDHAYCTDVHVSARNSSTKRDAKVPQARRSGKKETLVDAIVGGERVLLANPKETERSIELQVRVALAAAGVFVKKHTVEPCPCCGAKPKPETGMGKGTTDLICVVPPYGRALFIEMKHPKRRSRTSKAQKHFIAAVQRFGAVAGVATSAEEALALVALARKLP